MEGVAGRGICPRPLLCCSVSGGACLGEALSVGLALVLCQVCGWLLVGSVAMSEYIRGNVWHSSAHIWCV